MSEKGFMERQEYLIGQVCDEVKELLIRKNRDYRSSFANQFEKYGILSGLIRIDDKIERLSNLVNGHNAEVAESIEDSLRDLCGYAALTLVELMKQKKK